MRKPHEQESKKDRETSNGEVPSKRRKKPRYEPKLRELRVGEMVVKRFTQKSDAQEIILLAFQEEGWPQVIDDPLTRKEEQDPQQRLRTTVANLKPPPVRAVAPFPRPPRGHRRGLEILQERRQQSDTTATVERQ